MVIYIMNVHVQLRLNKGVCHIHALLKSANFKSLEFPLPITQMVAIPVKPGDLICK
jgi:hypothetical protein